MKKNRNFGMNIGASSILVIIVILTLICFAGLSLASANADYQLCLKLADRTSAYYEATSKAYEELALFYEENKKESSDVSENSFVNEFYINDNQVLNVEAIINPDNDSKYEFKTFKIKTVKEPELEDKLSLLLN